jgi:hypothetical protein
MRRATARDARFRGYNPIGLDRPFAVNHAFDGRHLPFAAGDKLNAFLDPARR